MEDVVQILIWEKRRCAMKWWNVLTNEEKLKLTPPEKNYVYLSVIKIEYLYFLKP
jgi:hypothetical protein